ncbi:hypothetical protein FA95DRAFT_1072755 [Auriscalpium vulgare]|uniref:Uncharacterized protein n=1 Tax=Auriscalpium vulgare TaxID=40419 RepID=A0ACB8RX35_9AGAM|nr:hypothetical protein FA95DRAFT_1072755 [Auriscalpium vulgare]
MSIHRNLRRTGDTGSRFSGDQAHRRRQRADDASPSITMIIRMMLLGMLVLFLSLFIVGAVLYLAFRFVEGGVELAPRALGSSGSMRNLRVPQPEDEDTRVDGESEPETQWSRSGTRFPDAAEEINNGDCLGDGEKGGAGRWFEGQTK